MRVILSSLCCATALLLSACGFHLEKQQVLPSRLHSIHVEADHFDALTRRLESSLSAAGATVMSNGKNADITLKITQENRSQEAQTIGASQQSREYALRYTVTFILTNREGKLLAGPLMAHNQRTQVLQSSQILGATSQTDDLYNDMLNEVVKQIMDQLGSESVQRDLNAKPDTTSAP